MHAVRVNPHAVHFAAIGLVLFSPRVQARSFVYGPNDFGPFIVDGRLIDKLRSNFNEDTLLNSQGRWGGWRWTARAASLSGDEKL